MRRLCAATFLIPRRATGNELRRRIRSAFRRAMQRQRPAFSLRKGKQAFSNKDFLLVSEWRVRFFAISSLPQKNQTRSNFVRNLPARIYSGNSRSAGRVMKGLSAPFSRIFSAMRTVRNRLLAIFRKSLKKSSVPPL